MEGDPLDLFLLDHIKQVGAGELLAWLIGKERDRVTERVRLRNSGHPV